MNLLKRITHSGQAVQETSSHPPKQIVLAKTSTDIPGPSRSSTQPIPIKATKSWGQYESDEEAEWAKYDLATWNMYVLIVSARRFRAVERSSNDCTQHVTSTESIEHPPAPRVHRNHEPVAVSPELNEAPYDGCYGDIFELDDD